MAEQIKKDPEAKMWKEDRIINVEVEDNKKPMTTTGLVDSRLFTGENKLHGIRGPDGLWIVKYERGIVPEVLKQKFTSFSQLTKFVEGYFKKRNIVIKEITDAPDS